MKGLYINSACVLIFMWLCNFCSTFQPVVVTTWNFVSATDSAWEVLSSGGSAVSAVVSGCSYCEFAQCDGSVGFGSTPDENGETTLDAMVMDGAMRDMGAVMALRGVKNAIGVAEAVMKYTHHSILVGGLATDFASQMGFPVENLTSENSQRQWQDWLSTSCQPNFWKDVVPEPQENCGPYSQPDQYWTGPDDSGLIRSLVTEHNHDTIGMVAVDQNGDVAVGTSTNGLRFKIPGRVGDTAVVGAGGYADNSAGGAAATGDGDILVRFLPSLKTVEYMKQGFDPSEAAAMVFEEMVQFYPDMRGGVVAVDLDGNVGGSCSFPSSISYSYRYLNDTETTVGSLSCI